MKKHSALASLLASILAAVAVLPGASAGTLTVNSGTTVTGAAGVMNFNGGSTTASNGGTLTFSGSNSYSSPLVFNGTAFISLTVTSAKMPELSGSADDLQLTLRNDGNTLRIKTNVSISNTGTKAAKGVTATVYVSNDALLDSNDTKVKTLKLSDYLPGVTKLLKDQTFILPVKYKVPTAIASYLEGKYLIAVLSYEVAPGVQSATYVTSPNDMLASGNFVSLNGISNPVVFSNYATLATTGKNIVVIGPIHLPTNN